MAGQYPGKGVHAQHKDYALRALRARVAEYRQGYDLITARVDPDSEQGKADIERAAARWASYADLLETVERLAEKDRVRTRTDTKAHPE
ncbi:hypothetical protein PBI_EDMUNDO_61 [Arthrobacter phage Edmundo]|nr:hypothetical protein PBI_EDMUNDO_61 [Arthrobacter phage Edmundo]